MRPGITIQHARERPPESDVVRSDITGIIGIIPRFKWPQGATRGDFIELPCSTWREVADSPIRKLVDVVTMRAVYQFFVNGGEQCRIIAVCVNSERDLTVDNPFESVFSPLLDRLRAEEDIGLLAIPVMSYLPYTVDRMGVPTMPTAPTIKLFLEHCREMNNRFLILDTPKDLHEEPLMHWVQKLRKDNEHTASYGALYYPWLKNGDDEFPPSGSIAGVYARTEREHQPFGVRWPPANTVIRGVTHPAFELKWRESDALIAAHINPILTQPTRGVVVWGARTLSADPRWLHVNSRRITSMIAEQLRRDSEWVVFEHQRPELWEIVTRTVRARLDTVWAAGLLTGDRAGLDYTVQCDAELNPPEVRNAGQINVQVMIRPISTAEFIVVELRLGN